MKSLKMLVLLGCVLALVSSAYAGEWHVAGQFGSSHAGPGYWGGYAVQFGNTGRLPPPGHWVHPWGGGYWPGHGWGHPYGWGTWYPRPPIYLRAPDYGYYYYPASPWVGSTVTVITGSGVGYAAAAEERVVYGPSGVFMVPVTSAAPKVPADQVSAAGLPAPQTGSAWTSAERPRRNLEGLSKVFRVGGFDRVDTELSRLLRSNPADAQVSYTYAYVLFVREKYPTAAFVLRRAVMLDGKLAASGRSILEGFYETELTTRSLAKLDEYVAAHPGDVEARLVRAYGLFLEGKLAEARADLEVVLKSNSADPQAALLLNLCTPVPETDR